MWQVYCPQSWGEAGYALKQSIWTSWPWAMQDHREAAVSDSSGEWTYSSADVTANLEKVSWWTANQTWPNSVPLLQSTLTVSWAASGELFPTGWGRWSSTRERWSYLGENSKEPLQWLADWNISFVRKGWESWNSLVWRRLGGGWISLMCTNTLKEAVKTKGVKNLSSCTREEWSVIRWYKLVCKNTLTYET